jgi:predicted DNA-binding transcriptional regulator AlpA
MTTINHKFYTISDIATLFNVHKNTVRRWRDNGEIPKPISINSQSLFWPKEIFDAFLTEKQNEGRPQ